MTERRNGIHYDIPEQEYHDSSRLSASQIVAGLRSLAHMKYEMDNPRPDTPAFLFGRAVHAAVLEPESFEHRYTFSGDCAAIITSGARKGEACGAGGKVRVDGEWRCGRHMTGGGGDAYDLPAQTIIPVADWDACMAIRDKVYNNPWASAMLAQAKSEVSVYWNDPNTDLECRARPDALNLDVGAHVNLKTTLDASHGVMGFQRDFFKYNYHVSFAHYDNGLLMNDRVVDHYALAVEKNPPYEVSVFRVTRDVLTVGRTKLNEIMQEIQYAKESGYWPGYSSEIVEIEPRRWMEEDL